MGLRQDSAWKLASAHAQGMLVGGGGEGALPLENLISELGTALLKVLEGGQGWLQLSGLLSLPVLTGHLPHFSKLGSFLLF